MHSISDDKMVDRFSAPLLAAIGPAAKGRAGGVIPPIASGPDAAFAVVTLIDFAARTVPPRELCDRYIELGAARPSWASRDCEERSALTASHARLPASETFSEQALSAIHQEPGFAQSFALDEFGPHLSATAASASQAPQAQAVPFTAAPAKAPRRGARRAPI